MYKESLRKPDGRSLILYSRRPIPPGLTAPMPVAGPVLPSAHFRWHPLRGEWVAYASHRQDRTFLPPPEYNPLAPERPGAPPTELPSGDYDAAAFENLFPTLTGQSGPPPAELYVPTRESAGVCEVVVFTQDAKASLGGLPLDHVELLFQVWADRTATLGSTPEIEYVMPFENRGVEVGVTLHHPHGQIYAYPFVPPLPARALEEQRTHFRRTGRGLMTEILDSEIHDGRRLLYHGPEAVAFLPAFARYSYEVWVAPRRPLPFLQDLTGAERADLARALKTVLLKYDGLWNKPFPYLMAIHQAPTDGRDHPESHLHIEFFPPLRTRDRLKFLAGTELAAGMFASDSLPEDKARELQAVDVHLE